MLSKLERLIRFMTAEEQLLIRSEFIHLNSMGRWCYLIEIKTIYGDPDLGGRKIKVFHEEPI